MIRVLLVRVLIFLLPFALYAVYAKLVLRRRVLDIETWRAAPMVTLVAIGFALVAASLFALALTSGSDPEGRYVPAHMEDGELVPGRIDSDPEPQPERQPEP